jgi:hypothetical protein
MNLIHGPKEPEMSKVRTKETDGKGLKSKGPLTEGPHEEREKVKSKGWLGVALAAGIAVFSFGTAVLTTNCTFSTKGIPAEQHDGGEEEDAAVDADTKDVKVPDAKVTDAKVLDAALDAGEDAAILDLMQPRRTMRDRTPRLSLMLDRTTPRPRMAEQSTARASLPRALVSRQLHTTQSFKQGESALRRFHLTTSVR